ncbi:MAG: PepSY domain-containing protein [Candidatus Sedimenticola sp. (ex Thyasira tokunagai)]
MKRVLAILLLFLAAGGLFADEDHRIARELLMSGKVLSLEHILEQLKPQFPGARILEVELEQEDENIVYEIELLDSGGRVWELELDATDGRLLKRKQEE